jgi:MFS family permease
MTEGDDFGERSGCCRGKRNYVVALLLSMNLFEAMNGTLTGLLIPVIALDFGCSTEVAAWISLGPSFTSAMLGPPIGMVADTIGRTTVWRVFAGVLMVCLPICGLANSVFMLIIARTVSGVSWAGCGPAGFAIMAQGVEPSRRGIISAWQQTTGMFGGSVGTAAGGVLISVMGWRYVFFVSMVPITSIWLLNFLILPKDAEMSRAQLRDKLESFDWAGTFLFVLSCGAALMLINRGNDMGW